MEREIRLEIEELEERIAPDVYMLQAGAVTASYDTDSGDATLKINPPGR